MAGLIIAIDPGIKGGVAWWFEASKTSFAQPMPVIDKSVDSYALADLFAELVAQSPDVQVVIEKVGGFVAGKAAPGSAMFNFGYSCGLVMGVIAHAGMPVIQVTPQSWQKFLGVGGRGSRTPNAWKNHLKAVAQKLYPKLKVTAATADALLILDYAKTR